MVTADNWEFYQELQNWLNELTSFKDQLYGKKVSHDELETLRSRLVRTAPKFKARVIKLVGQQYGEQLGGQRFDIWAEALSPDVLADMLNWRNRWSLEQLPNIVNEALGKLEAGEAVESRPMAETRQVQPPKAFIAHGGASRARAKLEDFLLALGVEPLIVEERPSEGRSVNDNVGHYFNQSDCAIILATKGDIDSNTGEFIPRGNILIEVGMSLQRLPNKTIYLLEKGAKFPSDISEKVWERFTHGNMEKAFIKVAKELKAFGLLEAVKP